ncbi:hypothetical protein CDO33_17375 [Clostridium thermosuccinogenes]|nr:hypothetical protein CDO33_17375 [Pseudoclostridium thermosuccinogenes]
MLQSCSHNGGLPAGNRMLSVKHSRALLKICICLFSSNYGYQYHYAERESQMHRDVLLRSGISDTVGMYMGGDSKGMLDACSFASI